MQGREKCGGLNGCKLGGTYVEYDQIKFMNDTFVKRVRLTAHFANDVPDLNYLRGTDGKYSYTPSVSSFCTAGYELLEGSNYFVTLCSVLRDAQL